MLANEVAVLLRLGLVKIRLHDRPADGMEDRLDIDHSTRPSVEEIEVLIWDTSDQGQDTFATGQGNRQWSQGVREDSNTVREATDATSSVVFAW